MNCEFHLRQLQGNDWLDLVPTVEEALRAELLGPDGLVRAMKGAEESARKAELEAETENLRQVQSLIDIDQTVEEVTRSWLRINTKYSNMFYVDYVSHLGIASNKILHPYTSLAIEMLHEQDLDLELRNRINGLLGKVVGASLNQANKSNAGTAGEALVRSLFNAAGLVKDVHFREQYKSSYGGSDADFVFPSVMDRHDSMLEVVIAVQFSSNDRIRMSASELNKGVKNYVVTGNGLSASSKSLRSIGDEIIASFSSENIKIVCYSDEKAKEIDRLQKRIANPKTDAERRKSEDRLRFVRENVDSFETFVRYLAGRTNEWTSFNQLSN